MEHLTSFVSSRGLMRAYDAHNRLPVSSRPEIDVDLVARLPDGGSVYVCTDALHGFIRDILPTVERPFTLVSADIDIPISPAMLDALPIRTLLECPKLLAWYAQNLQASHPKLHGLPIWLDYHTMWSTPGLWGMTAISPIAQEHALLSAHAAFPTYDERYLASYCNWYFALNWGDRQECIDRIDMSALFFETHPIPRNSSWQRQAECMFVVSPEGPLAVVFGWLRNDRHKLSSGTVPTDSIIRAHQAASVTHLDLVIIDGMEFTGRSELDAVGDCRMIVLLARTRTLKNWSNFNRLASDTLYEPAWSDQA